MNNDQTAANSFEITADLAEAAEGILEDFAQDAELDVAVIVEESGALIAGISADDEIDVHVVAALVAGNLGATRALGKVVGESGLVETVNQGADKITYLRELNEKFVLVGIAEAILPPGIIREKAAQISEDLVELLETGGISEKPVQIELGIDSFDEEIEEPVEDESEGDIFDLSDTSVPSPHHEAPGIETEAESDETDDSDGVKIAPMVVDSPFEIADDDSNDDFEAEVAVDEAADEVEPVFEIGGEENEESESGEPESSEDSSDDRGDEDEISISAPMLVTPAVASEEEKAKRREEEEETTAVASISTPISTDIAKKIDIDLSDSDTDDSASSPDGKPVSEDTPDDVDDENEDDDDDEEAVGGPRYVFEIG